MSHVILEKLFKPCLESLTLNMVETSHHKHLHYKKRSLKIVFKNLKRILCKYVHTLKLIRDYFSGHKCIAKKKNCPRLHSHFIHSSVCPAGAALCRLPQGIQWGFYLSPGAQCYQHEVLSFIHTDWAKHPAPSPLQQAYFSWGRWGGSEERRT